jgi:hypothetical protein
MAVNLVEGRGIVDNMGNYAMYNVGYPLFILAPVFAVLGNNVVAAQLINAMLGAGCSVICYAIAREIGLGRNGALLAAGLWALYLPSWVYAEYLAKENLMTVLMVSVVWCALRLLKDVCLRIAGVCGTVLGVLALTGNSGLALFSTVVLALLVASSPVRKKFVVFSLIVILTLSVVAPWVIRNARVVGAPVLNTNFGFNLYLGNNPAATGYFVSIADTPRGKTWERLRTEGEVKASWTLLHDAIDWIAGHPSQFIELALRKAVLFWKPPAVQATGSVSVVEIFWRQMWLLQFVILIVASIASLLFPLSRTRQAALLFIAIASYTAVHMVFYVSSRYREPIMPLLCVLTALTLESLVKSFARSVVMTRNG